MFDLLAIDLLKLLSAGKAMSARQLHSGVEEKGERVSLVAVYKAINRLMDERIIVKNGISFSLSLSYLLDHLAAIEDTYNRLVAQSLTRAELPSMGESRTWHFQSLRQLDLFWMQMIFLLFEVSGEKLMSQWAPRLWFPHIDLPIDEQHLRGMRRTGNKVRLLIGGQSYLDILPSSLWPQDTYECLFGDSPFQNQRELYYCSIGEFLLTVKVSKASAIGIDELFERVQRQAEFTRTDQWRLFDSKSGPKLTIERSTKRSVRVKKDFEKAFRSSALITGRELSKRLKQADQR